MNELLFAIVAFLALTLVLIGVRLGTHWLSGIVIILLLMANIFATKLTTILGYPNSLAVPLYAAIFLATDSASEHFGRKAALRMVWMGFLAQTCMVVFGQIIIRADILGDPAAGEALASIFNLLPRLALGSFVAYLISQHFDVAFYHYLKSRTRGRHLWLRNCLSTIVSQGIDTVIFLLIAFYGIIEDLHRLILAYWIAKLVIAILDTPFIYLTYYMLRKPLPGNPAQREDACPSEHA